jgi:hypothetical protein
VLAKPRAVLTEPVVPTDRVDGEKVAASPAGTDDDANETVPLKPPKLEIVMVEVVGAPAVKRRLLGLAELVYPAPVTLMLATKVDQQFPLRLQLPAARLWYSPATHTRLVSEGSSAAPK